MRHDVERFDRWAPTYDQHRLQRIVFEPMQKTVLELAFAQVPNPRAILDVGCGTGRLLRAAAERFPGATLEGIDAAPGMVRQAAAALSPVSRIRFRQGTAEQLPFSDNQFDLVFSTMTFHHWTDQALGITEVARVLKPEGRWLMADFVARGLMRYVRRLLRLKQFPERAEFDAMLQPAGLGVFATVPVQGLRGQVPVLAIGHLARPM